MKDNVSIGVVMPTLDCASLVEGHVNSINEWLDLVEEIVVVDSDSKDGTVDYLTRHLKHPNVRFLRHPRGLYQSWNFGIRHLSQKYTYVSTVGDSITREGLLRLREVAETHRCDAVASKPRFIDNEGRPTDDVEWPIDRLLRRYPQYRPLVLEGLILHHFAMRDITGAIFGSSASNLYLTETLHKCPFPAEFGTIGDMVWSLVHGLDARVVLIDEKFSTFRFHPKAYSASEYAIPNVEEKVLGLGREAFNRRASQEPELRAKRKKLLDSELGETCDELDESLRSLCRARQSIWPWVLNPGAWAARAARDRLRREMAEAKQFLIEEMRRIQIRSDLKRFAENKGNGPMPANGGEGILARPALTP